MKAALLKLEQRVDSLPLRQRIALFVSGIAVIAAIAWMGKLAPLTVERQALHATMQQQQDQIAAADQGIAAILKAYEADPNAPLRQRLATVQELTRAVGDELSDKKRGLVQPQRIVPLLQQILRGHPGLRVSAMRTLPVSGLQDGKFSQSTPAVGALPSAGPAPVALLYRHGVELEVRGSYADLLGYMEAQEKVSPRLIWGSAKLSVIKHPEASLTLTVYTLSLDDTWVQL